MDARERSLDVLGILSPSKIDERQLGGEYDDFRKFSGSGCFFKRHNPVRKFFKFAVWCEGYNDRRDGV
jgi:hypothetical protein